MKNVSVLIGEGDNDVISEFQRLIGNHERFNITNIVSTPKAVIETVRSSAPQIVFISTDLFDEEMDAFELCRQVVGEFPSTIVIMTSIDEHPDELRLAMRVGARDLIGFQDFESRLVDTTVELAETFMKYESSAIDRKGKVISVLSPKGGVGKTTMAINLASELATRLNEEGELNRVLILDFDLQFGDISYLSDIKSERTLRTIADLNELPSVDLDAFRGHLYESPNYGYWVLSAPTSPQYADVIERYTLEKAIVLAKKLFDYVVIDNTQGFTTASVVAVDNSDLIVVASSGQMVDMKNLQVMLSTLNKLVDSKFAKDRITLLLTQYTKYCIPEKEVMSRFKAKSIGVIPRNDNIASSANNYNKTIIKDFKKSDVAVALKSAIDQIEYILNPLDSNAKVAEQGQTKKRGVLSTLFGK